MIAERDLTYVSENAQIRDGLLIRRSQVRALVGEPIFNGLGSFERPTSVIFSAIFFSAPYAKSASIKKIEDKEPRTLDLQVACKLRS